MGRLKVEDCPCWWSFCILKRVLIYPLTNCSIAVYTTNSNREVVNINEKTITVRISEDLHRAIKIKIAQEGVSLKDYVVSLIQKDLEKSK